MGRETGGGGRERERQREREREREEQFKHAAMFRVDIEVQNRLLRHIVLTSMECSNSLSRRKKV